MLEAAANVVQSDQANYDMLDYIMSLSEGIMDAWGGIIIAMKQGHCMHSIAGGLIQANRPEAHSLTPFVSTIFNFLNQVAQSSNRSEGLLRATMGIIG